MGVLNKSMRVGETPYQIEAAPEAGIYLDTGERWWGTRVRWRPGLKGKWRTFVLEGVHPFDQETVDQAVEAVIERHRGSTKRGGR
jgi:hypothetical protein